MSALAPTLQAWFTDRLIAQHNVSPPHDRLPRHAAGCCSTTPSNNSDASPASSTSLSSTRR